MTADLARLAGRLLALVAGLFVLILALGLLVTHVLNRVPPVSGEDAVNRTLAADRTPTGNEVSHIVTSFANTPSIVLTMVVLAVVFRLVFHRWRESAFLVLAVTVQAAVFLFVTLLISRQRPHVRRLDSSPPTSSFPSGHTGAATALFVAIAVVLAWHTREVWLRTSVVVLLLLVPVAVAFSRLYRGMHHPTDIVGAYVNGGLSVLLAARALLFAHLPPALTRVLDRSQAGAQDTRSSRTRSSPAT